MSKPTERTLPMDPRLSALIVNYDSGDFAVTCAESLMDEWRREGQRADRLEIILVDNASPSDQSEPLARLEERGVRLVRSTTNLGYAGGVNRAFSESSGDPTDLVAVLNPDIVFLPGSLRPLLRTLALHPDCGAVAPRTTVDPDGHLQLPPVQQPTAADEAGAALAHLWPAFARLRGRRRAVRSLQRWTEHHPLDVKMLSGACLFLRRDTVEQLGMLMDADYPLYYEDADLCRRIRDLGLRLVLHPESHVVHHWSRSAGHAERFERVAAPRLRASQALWRARRFTAVGRFITERLERLAAKRSRCGRTRTAHRCTDLGSTEAPPRFTWERTCSWVLEVSLSPAWTLAAGNVGIGSSVAVPRSAWEWLFPARYYARVLDRHTGRLLGAWTFEKTTEARTESVSGAERARAVPAGIPRQHQHPSLQTSVLSPAALPAAPGLIASVSVAGGPREPAPSVTSTALGSVS